MASQTERPVFHAIDANGQARALKAEALELRWPDGRRLSLSLPASAWGDLELHAEAADGTPVTLVKPSACNLLTVRVDVLHDAQDADAGAPAVHLELDVQNAVPKAEDSKAVRPKKRQIRAWVAAALSRDAALAVRLVGEDEARALNRDFRGKDYPTNVLTFIYDETGDTLNGDLVICLPVVLREAQAQGKTVAAHFAHLVVHGVLHLQGFDHENDDEAQAMEARESDILEGLGFANPYDEV
ncbi:MAG: rRNA maturation RNase YbeY [Rhodocyclaceae bacterium]|nr:rRNA maturation RNase YbeY [Rhodocyclaceae bacterium]